MKCIGNVEGLALARESASTRHLEDTMNDWIQRSETKIYLMEMDREMILSQCRTLHDQNSYIQGKLCHVESECRTLHDQNSYMQGKLYHVESDNVVLRDRISVLENSSTLLTDIRNRFLSIFKRKHMDKRVTANRLTAEDWDFIDSGNIDAHGGNARFDATLYSPGGRTDIAVFQQLYGVQPSVIQEQQPITRNT